MAYKYLYLLCLFANIFAILVFKTEPFKAQNFSHICKTVITIYPL